MIHLHPSSVKQKVPRVRKEFDQHRDRRERYPSHQVAMNGPRSELQAKMPNLRDEPLKAGCRGKQKELATATSLSTQL